ncbi:MAG: hypothetical protein V2B13_16245 [Pseudomonadota bacterium]
MIGEKMKASGQLKITAYHEAGHAIASYCLGIKFRYISIESDDNKRSLGKVGFRAFNKISDLSCLSLHMRDKFERHIMISLAGLIVEKMFFKRKKSSGWEKDFHDVAFFIREFCESQKAAKYFYLYMHEQTKNCMKMPFRRSLVKKLAHELLKRKRMNWNEFIQFVSPPKKTVGEEVRGDELEIWEQIALQQDQIEEQKNGKSPNICT